MTIALVAAGLLYLTGAYVSLVLLMTPPLAELRRWQIAIGVVAWPVFAVAGAAQQTADWFRK